MTLTEIIETAVVNSLGLTAVAWITNRLTTANQRALAKESADRALEAEKRSREEQVAAEKRARKRQAAADERADRRQAEAAALALKAQEASDARASRREADAAIRADVRQAQELRLREERRAMLERLTLQRASVEEYVRLWQESYRGPTDAETRNRRIADRQPFRARVMFAFGDEAFANEVVGSLFHAEDVNAGRDDSAELRYADPMRWTNMLKTERTALGKMLASIKRLEVVLGYEALVLTKQTEKHAVGDTGDGGAA